MKVTVQDLYDNETHVFQGDQEKVRQELLAKYPFGRHNGDSLEQVLKTIGKCQGYNVQVEQ